VLNGGTIEFVNPAETQPVVNLALNTTIQQYNISMRFNGPVDQLRTNYSSDPSLPAADIINLLAFGTTTEASANAPSTPASQAAQSLVASQVSSQVTSRVSKVAGISQLSINPVLQEEPARGPRAPTSPFSNASRGISSVTFSSNVASTQNQTIQGQYQISPRVAVSATRDQKWRLRFDTLIKKNLVGRLFYEIERVHGNEDSFAVPPQACPLLSVSAVARTDGNGRSSGACPFIAFQLHVKARLPSSPDRYYRRP